MSKEFNDWWNADSLVEDNPFRKESPAFWAWEGWHAGVVAEREACAKLCEEENEEWGWDAHVLDCAEAIRARGQG